MAAYVKKQTANVLVVTKNNNVSSFTKKAIIFLSEYYDVVDKYESLDNVNLEKSNSPVVIFDGIDIDDIKHDILRVENINNIKPFYVYVNKKLNQEKIEVILRKEFDYLIDGDFINAKNFGLRLVNIFRKHFELSMKSETMFIDDLTINSIERKIWKGNDLIRLTTLEFNLLILLIKNMNKIVSQEKIFKNIWDTDDEDRTRVVTQYIYRLKSKIGKEYITSVSSKGYIFSPMSNKNK